MSAWFLDSELSTFITLAFNRMDGRGHINTAHRERLPKKTKVMQYYPKDGALHL